MLSFKKKERRTLELLLRFVDTVAECVEKAQASVTHYLANGQPAPAELQQEVDGLESEADKLRRKILERLFTGSSLADVRDDLYQVIHLIDDVANAAEACTDFFLGERPAIPATLKKPLREITLNSFGIFKPLQKAMECLLSPKGSLDELSKLAKQVGEIESVVDDQEARLTHLIFGEESIEFARRLHLKQGLTQLADIADRAENAADQIERAALKAST